MTEPMARSVSDKKLRANPQARLIDAAVELFARHGYDSVSTGMIAKSAGLTQSMVHYHFGDKEAIWKAAITEIMQRRGATFPLHDFSELKDVDPVTRLKVMIRSFVRTNALVPELHQVMIHEGVKRSSRLDWLVERYMSTGYKAFDVAVQQAIEAGRIKPLPFSDVTNVIIGACTLAFSVSGMIETIYGSSPSEEKGVASMTESILQIIFDGLSLNRI